MPKEGISWHQSLTTIATKHFSEKLLIMEMNEINIEMNQPLYLGLSTQDISTIAMDKYLKPRYGKMAKLCYIDTGSFIPHVTFMQNLLEIIRKDLTHATMIPKDHYR